MTRASAEKFIQAIENLADQDDIPFLSRKGEGGRREVIKITPVWLIRGLKEN